MLQRTAEGQRGLCGRRTVRARDNVIDHRLDRLVRTRRVDQDEALVALALALSHPILSGSGSGTVQPSAVLSVRISSRSALFSGCSSVRARSP
eukprot:2893699-Prymnesium_polylepis.2